MKRLLLLLFLVVTVIGNAQEPVFKRTSYDSIKEYKRLLVERTKSAEESWKRIKTQGGFKADKLRDVAKRDDYLTLLIARPSFGRTKLHVLKSSKDGIIDPVQSKAKNRKKRCDRMLKKINEHSRKLPASEFPYKLRNFTVAVIIPFSEIRDLLSKAHAKYALFYLGIEKGKKEKGILFEHLTVCVLASNDGEIPSEYHEVQNGDGLETWPIEQMVFVKVEPKSATLSWPKK